MKKTIFTTVLALSMTAAIAMAQDNMDMDMDMADGQNMQQGQGMMYGGMGQGMMGGRGMMGGKGMMMQGRQGCINMMEPGMGQWMMKGGGMMTNMSAEKQQQFMDETTEKRKKKHTLRFEYMEAKRNPKTTLSELADMEQKMLDIRKEMMKKAEKYQDNKK
jgi:hypothetical protein